MLSLVWERIEVLIAASALALQIASYVREAKASSADRQRTRVVVRERVREVRIGRWIVWRSSVRREDFDRS